MDLAAKAEARASAATARLCRMNSAPNVRSASNWLWARQRSRTLDTVAVPPRRAGSHSARVNAMWSWRSA